MKLRGKTTVPGDKSISHRALLIGSISKNKSTVRGLNRGADCARTLSCLQALGVSISEKKDALEILGHGDMCLHKPQDILDCGNSGTTLRLLAGLLAGQDFVSILDGDQSLKARPMDRIVKPLRFMGADLFGTGSSNLAPLTIKGGSLKGICYELPVPSAQVKSALLLAGLQASGTTTVIEPISCRDHTERMLKDSGANLQLHPGKIELIGGSSLEGRHFEIPGDFSAAAFLIGAAVALPGSELVVEKVGLNPTRLGFLETLKTMGASVEVVDLREEEGEPSGTIVARGSKLNATTVGGNLIPRLVDEIPILAVLATQAHGTTVIKDAEELRLKESDRLACLAQELTKLGAQIREFPAGLEITGPSKLKGARVDSYGDHRLALAWQVASLFSTGKVQIEKREATEISFPEFNKIWSRIIVG